MERENILEELRTAIVQGEPEQAQQACAKALEAGLDITDILSDGITKGMEIVGQKWNSQEYFLPDVLAAVEAVKAGNDYLLPQLKSKEGGEEAAGTVVIGTVKGDIHNIGKNLVATFLEVSGFKVYNLGEDVPAERFVEAALEHGADVVGSSAFISSVATEMVRIEELLKAAGIRDKVFTMVGGCVLDPVWAAKIGADAYGRDAMHAVELAKAFMAKKRAQS